ncbi:MAG TPA: hypothetical protein VFQ91_27650 [Bryobacteraceae bacterium]|nr:hypothetical protein [Bryobacteraceae bacterium]
MIVYSHPGLEGLEVWHGMTRYSSLDQLRTDKAAYFAGLTEFLADLHAGKARTADGCSLRQAAAFTRLLLAGGDAAEAAGRLGWPHEVADASPYSAKRGAEAIWREMGWTNPVAIDLGQTRLKCLTPDGSSWRERDWERFPHGRAALEAEQARDRLRAFVAGALPAEFDGCVLGLPVAVDEDGVAESSTYPGLYGPLEPLFGPVFGERPWVVVNDAVLTGRGFPPEQGEKTLVLTLGFGVGGALWR